MISIEDVMQLHQLSIDKFGGSHGLRDEGLLSSAVSRPFQTFDGNDLYPSVHDKAAAIFESLIINHPFVDGNKRTGYLAMFTVLKFGGYKLSSSEENAYNITIKVSTGEIKFEQIVEWLKSNTKPF